MKKIILYIILLSVVENIYAHNWEKIDTSVAQNDSFVLVFEGFYPECGINIFQSPTHGYQSYRRSNEADTMWYIYKPDMDYIGKDTFVLVSGCMIGGNPDSIVADTIVYCINVENRVKIHKYDISESNIIHGNKIDLSNVKINGDKNIKIVVISQEGKVLFQKPLTNTVVNLDLLNLPKGLNIISIWDDNQFILNKKMIFR